MTKLGTMVAPMLAVAMLSGSAGLLAQGYPQQQQGYGQQQQGYPQGPPPQQGGYGDRDRGGWDAPPQDFRTDVQRQGFRDGIQGARQDFETHRQPNSAYRAEFRHPPVPRPARADYRFGFQRGYDVAMRHMMERHEEHRDGYRPDGYQPR